MTKTGDKSYYFSLKEGKILILKGVLIVLCCLDNYQTSSMIQKYGIDAEYNPILKTIYNWSNLSGMLLFKSILLGLAIYLVDMLIVLVILVMWFSFVVFYNHQALKES